MCELEQWHTLPLAGVGKAGERRYAALREAVELLEAKASVLPRAKKQCCGRVCVCLCDIV